MLRACLQAFVRFDIARIEHRVVCSATSCGLRLALAPHCRRAWGKSTLGFLRTRSSTRQRGELQRRDHRLELGQLRLPRRLARDQGLRRRDGRRHAQLREARHGGDGAALDAEGEGPAGCAAAASWRSDRVCLARGLCKKNDAESVLTPSLILTQHARSYQDGAWQSSQQARTLTQTAQRPTPTIPSQTHTI